MDILRIYMKFLLVLILLISGSLYAQEESLEDLQKETLGIVHDFQRNYMKYLGKASPNISVRMVSVKELLFDDSVSSCEKSPKIVVLVNKDIWMEASHEKREYTILHQLGHCVLNRIHKKEEMRNIPLTVMAFHNNVKHFKKYRDNYIHELFTDQTLPFMERLANER